MPLQLQCQRARLCTNSLRALVHVLSLASRSPIEFKDALRCTSCQKSYKISPSFAQAPPLSAPSCETSGSTSICRMTDTATKELHLSVIDRTMIRAYIKQLMIFPFPNSTHTDEALRNIRTGLSLTVQQLPFLAGTLVVDDLNIHNLKATYPEPPRPNEGDIILIASHALENNARFSYYTMEAMGFPPVMLPEHEFCPEGLRYPASGTFGVPIPIMMSQATFIPGGLVLSVYTHHTVVDGSGVDVVYKIWAAHTKNAKDSTGNTALSSSSGLVNSSALRRAIDAMSKSCTSDALPRCPELRSREESCNMAPLRPEPYHIVAKIISLSESSISRVKSELQAQTATRISTFVALVALFCSRITRARARVLARSSHKSTRLGVAMNMRTRCTADLGSDFVGNMSLFSSTKVPIEDCTSPMPLALALNATFSSVDAEWFTRRLKYLTTVEDLSTLAASCPSFSRDNGPDLFISSWQRLGMEWDWGIPGTSDGKPSAIRKPGIGDSGGGEGGLNIMPRREEAGRDYEVMVILEEGDMGRLIEGLGDLVKRVVDA